MISLKVLSTAAAIALALPVAIPSASFAQQPGKGGYAVRGGGGGGAPAVRYSGGGGQPVARFSGGGGAPVAQFRGGGGGAPVAQFRGGGGGAPVAQFNGGGGYRGGYAGGYGYRHHRGGGFWPGVAVGAAIGGSYAYYGNPGYYSPGYYDDNSYYYDDNTVAAAPAPAEGGDEAWCAQTYRSWDPASGTYLGYDGQRHPCP